MPCLSLQESQALREKIRKAETAKFADEAVIAPMDKLISTIKVPAGIDKEAFVETVKTELAEKSEAKVVVEETPAPVAESIEEKPAKTVSKKGGKKKGKTK